MLSWSSPSAMRARGDRDAACFAGKTLLVVGTGGPKRGPVFERLRSLGLARVLCLNDAANWAAPYVDEWLLSEDAVRAYPGRIDGVITFDEFGVSTAAMLCAQLGLPGPTPEVAERARDKRAFRAWCARHGLPGPGWATLDDAEAIARLRYPLVFKPTRGGGSALVRKIEDELALSYVLAGYQREVARCPGSASWGDSSAFVEEYLDGPEVDVDMLVQGGEVRYCEVTDNFATGEPYFLETGGCFPSRLPEATQAAVKGMAIATVQALGLADGCLHFEARVTPTGPVAIEANLRLGGAEVFAFHQAARGLDLVAEAVKIALGAPVAAPVPVRRWLASTNFVPSSAGRLAGVDVDPGVWRSPDLVEIVLFAEVGTPVAAPPESYQYMGWLVASGPDADAARANVDKLAAGVSFELL